MRVCVRVRVCVCNQESKDIFGKGENFGQSDFNGLLESQDLVLEVRLGFGQV